MCDTAVNAGDICQQASYSVAYYINYWRLNFKVWIPNIPKTLGGAQGASP